MPYLQWRGVRYFPGKAEGKVFCIFYKSVQPVVLFYKYCYINIDGGNSSLDTSLLIYCILVNDDMTIFFLLNNLVNLVRSCNNVVTKIQD